MRLDGQTGKIQVICQSTPVHMEYLRIFQTPTVSTKHKYFDELAILEKMFNFSFFYLILIFNL